MAAERYTVRNTAQKKASNEKSPAPKKNAIAEREKQRRKDAAQAVLRRRREKKENFILITILAIIFTIGYYAYIVIKIDTRPQAVDDIYDVQLFESGEKESAQTFKAADICFNNTSYLPITVLDGYCEYSEYGDEKTRAFMIKSSGEWASFNLGTVNAVINGQSVAISEVSFVKDGILYLPLDFYSGKMSCFKELSYSSSLGCNVLTIDPSSEAAFNSKSVGETMKIDRSSIPQAPVIDTPINQIQPTV